MSDSIYVSLSKYLVIHGFMTLPSGWIYINLFQFHKACEKINDVVVYNANLRKSYSFE